jgi:hypothetical protein
MKTIACVALILCLGISDMAMARGGGGAGGGVGAGGAAASGGGTGGDGGLSVFPMARTIAIVHIITVIRTVRLNKLLTSVTAKVLFSKGELSLMAIV